MEKTTLEKINRFTRRELGEDEVYTFSVILCDNDIDRDLERFSDEALVTLAEKFIGRTGISTTTRVPPIRPRVFSTHR